MFCVLSRRNAIGILMGVELILNSANINYLAFSFYGGGKYDGQIFAIFVIMLAAAEAVVGLAVVLGDLPELQDYRRGCDRNAQWISCAGFRQQSFLALRTRHRLAMDSFAADGD